MAFQTGTSTSIENLLQLLSTFLQANGWTQDFATTGDPGRIGFSKNSIYVAMQYTEASDGGTMAMYQSTSNDNATSVWLSTGDSGNGIASTNAIAFDLSRCVNQFAGPHTSYWFFENDASPAYCHVVVEVDSGRYRHFGFGEIDKIGDWIGGEYCYGHYWAQPGTQIDDPISGNHSIGIDGGNAFVGNTYPATMRVDGHAGEPSAATIWANIFFSQSGAGNDRAGNARWNGIGGWRGSREWSTFYGYRISEGTAYKPLVPIPVEIAETSGTPDRIHRCGYQADVRMVNIGNLEPGQIITIDGDDWYFFPWVRKQNLDNDTEESSNGGVAYKRVNA